MKDDTRGFTILEAMVGLVIFSVVAAGVLSILFKGQFSFQSQREMSRASEQARIAMDQIVRYLRYAGNDPQGYLKTNNIPAVEILGSGRVRINSDFTGATPSATGNRLDSTGDPDGALDSANERAVFRYDPQGKQLFIDVGYGESLLAERIEFFEFEFRDSFGNPTADSSSVAEVKVRLMVVTRTDAQTGQPNRFTLHSDVFLRSKAFNPFAAEP